MWSAPRSLSETVAREAAGAAGEEQTASMRRVVLAGLAVVVAGVTGGVAVGLVRRSASERTASTAGLVQAPAAEGLPVSASLPTPFQVLGDATTATPDPAAEPRETSVLSVAPPPTPVTLAKGQSRPPRP
jgi:hypothetical protein